MDIEKILRREKRFLTVREIKNIATISEKAIRNQLKTLEKRGIIESKISPNNSLPFKYRIAPQRKIIHLPLRLGKHLVYLCRNASYAADGRWDSDIKKVTCHTCLKSKEVGTW